MKCWCCLENEAKEHEQCKNCQTVYFRVKRLEETVLRKFSSNFESLEGKKCTYEVNGKKYTINTYVKRKVKDTVPHIANCVMYIENKKFTLTSMKIVTRKKFHWTDGTTRRSGETVEEFQLPTVQGDRFKCIPEIENLTRHKQDLLKEKILKIFDHYLEENKPQPVIYNE